MILTPRNTFIHICWENYEGNLEEKYNLANYLIFHFSSHKLFGYNYATNNISPKSMNKYTESEIIDNLIRIVEILNTYKIPWKGHKVRATFEGEFCFATLTDKTISFDYIGKSRAVEINL